MDARRALASAMALLAFLVVAALMFAPEFRAV